MSDNLFLNNLAMYSLQIGLLVGIAALLPALLRLRSPRARLLYWHVLLVACLTLPLAAPRRAQVVEGDVQIGATTAAAVTAAAPAAPARFRISLGEATLAALAAGAAIRIGWLLFGFAQLRRYRRRSRPLEPAPSWGVEASLRLSDDVASPVTFGWRKPVVLLPANFPELSERLRDAILAHECLHVRRRDFLFTLLEELVRAVFWFHPAIWWLLGEIQLAREQAVDRAAVDITNGREEYVDALLAIAGAPLEPDLAPAPLFLRKRHLKYRVVSLLKEVPMSRKRLLSALAACLCLMAAACWYVAGAFPLTAAPQVVADGAEVKVDLGGATLLHRAPVAYPARAAQAHISGTVTLQVTVDAEGNVADAQVLSGPTELRSASLQSVLQWHFARESAASARQLSITFQLPGTAGAQPSALGRATPPAKAEVPASAPRSMKISGIQVVGLPDSARSELLAALPVREGDLLTREAIQKLAAAVKAFDEHLSLSASSVPPPPGQQPDSVTIRIVAPSSSASAAPVNSPQQDLAPPLRVRVGGNVQQMNLVSKVNPAYPAAAKQARVQGHVILSATIATDGTIKDLKVVSGDPLFVPATLDAVKQWVYRPTLVNGNPVEVVTDIDVNYTLSQ